MIYLKGSGGDKYYSELYNGIAFACISLEDGLKSVICHNLEINKEYKRKEIDKFLLELNSQFKLNLKEENHRIRFLESVIQIEKKIKAKVMKRSSFNYMGTSNNYHFDNQINSCIFV